MLPDAVLRYADHEDAVVDLHLPDGPTDRGRRTHPRRVLEGGVRPPAHQADGAGPGAIAAWWWRRRSTAGCGNGGGWPVTADDVLLAVRRCPSCSAGSGSSPLPWSSPVTRPAATSRCGWPRTDLPVQRVVALAPVCDLGEAIRLGLGDDATTAFLGGADPTVADPMVLLADRPAAEVDIVHGVDDDDVPISLSRGLVAAHPWVRLHEVPGGSHGADRAGFRRLADRRRALLRR